MTKRNIKLFVTGIITAAIIIPLLTALGVPNFDTLLVSLFGEGNIWAIVFSLLLIMTMIILFVRKDRRFDV